MIEYEYQIALFSPYYSNIRIIQIIRPNTGEHLEDRVTLLILAGVQKKPSDHFGKAQRSHLVMAESERSSLSIAFLNFTYMAVSVLVFEGH